MIKDNVYTLLIENCNSFHELLNKGMIEPISSDEVSNAINNVSKELIRLTPKDIQFFLKIADRVDKYGEFVLGNDRYNAANAYYCFARELVFSYKARDFNNLQIRNWFEQTEKLYKLILSGDK